MNKSQALEFAAACEIKGIGEQVVEAADLKPDVASRKILEIRDRLIGAGDGKDNRDTPGSEGDRCAEEAYVLAGLANSK